MEITVVYQYFEWVSSYSEKEVIIEYTYNDKN